MSYRPYPASSWVVDLYKLAGMLGLDRGDIDQELEDDWNDSWEDWEDGECSCTKFEAAVLLEKKDSSKPLKYLEAWLRVYAGEDWYLLYLVENSDTGAALEIYPRHPFIGFSEDALYVKSETDLYKELKKGGASPVKDFWIEYG